MINTETLDTVTTEVAHHEEIFYQSAEFWVGLSFVLVIGLMFFPMYKVIKKAIYQRIERIKKELQEAENLKLEAQKLYAEYERKCSNVENEVSEIINGQKNTITQTKENKLRALDAFLLHKQEETDAQLEQVFESVKENIVEQINKNTMDLLTKVLSTKLTKNEYNRLIDDSINNIKNIEIRHTHG